MKVLVRAPLKLDCFIMSLPCIKGIRDQYPEAEICVHSVDHFQKIKDFAPYIHQFIFGKFNAKDFDLVFDLTGDDDTHLGEFHFVDRYLAKLPARVRSRVFSYSETLVGFDEVKSVKNKETDLVIFPFSHVENTDWDLEKYHLFLSYFFKMNPAKKVLLLGLEIHREKIETFFQDKPYPQEMLEIKISSLEGILSLLKRSAFVLTSSSPIKFLAANAETVLIELNFNESGFSKKCVYKNNSFLVNMKASVKNKVIYSSEELAFDNNAHFVSYLVTSILDDDEEKLRWFAEKYSDLADVFRVNIHPELGHQLLPVYWNQGNIAQALLECSTKVHKLGIQNPKIYEDFYFSIYDNSDLSQDQIFYDLYAIKKDIQRGRPEAHNTDFFIRQVMNISGQKLLENLPMTGSYYS